MDDALIETAYEKAVGVLKMCSHELGLKASALEEGYPQVWARDSMITLLGAALTDDSDIRKSCKASIETLCGGQTALGLIPNNVDVRDGRRNFQAYADGGLWLCIGMAYWNTRGNEELSRESYESMKKILEWYQYQDVHNEGLIIMEEGADWEDLFAVRGRGLLINALHYLALRAGAVMADKYGEDKIAETYREVAEQKKKVVDNSFWYKGDKNVFPFIMPSFGTEQYDEKGYDVKGVQVSFPTPTILEEEKYYIPYFTFRHFGEWFDSLGNLMMIISGIADKDRSERILKYISGYNLARPAPIKSIHPSIKPGRKDWREYYSFADLNFPDQYHNGGIWPFLGGFYVAALVKAEQVENASRMLHELAKLNQKGRDNEWEFNEWFHGQSGSPMGMSYQAWSAGMYIFAYECVKQGKVPLFDDL